MNVHRVVGYNHHKETTTPILEIQQDGIITPSDASPINGSPLENETWKKQLVCERKMLEGKRMIQIIPKSTRQFGHELTIGNQDYTPPEHLQTHQTELSDAHNRTANILRSRIHAVKASEKKSNGLGEILIDGGCDTCLCGQGFVVESTTSRTVNVQGF